MRNWTLRGLRVFEAAAATASYSRAADLLGITRSAVSQQIHQLEQELGTTLFDTQARPIRLSDAGVELLRHSRVILAQVGIAEDALASLAGEQRGLLHVGVVSPGHYFMPALFADFRRLHPSIRLKMSLGRRDALLAQLGHRQLDLVVGGYPPAEADVEAEVFARHPHGLVAAPEHPLAERKQLSWADLAQQTFVFRERGSATRNFLEHLLQTERLQVCMDLELQGAEAVKAAVIAGLGISFVSAHTVQLELETGRIAWLDVLGLPKLLDWCVLTQRGIPLSTLQRLLRDHLLEHGARFASCTDHRWNGQPAGGSSALPSA